MADVIDYKIHGDDMQIVEVALDPGEGVRAEAGAMMFMEDGIEMQTSTGGGLFSGFKRMITGESFFITTFLYNGRGKGHVAFGAPYPGKIIPLDLDKLGGRFLCQKDAFLCAARGIEIEIAFTKKIGAGLFGGEGFILQRLEGHGLAFVHAGGTIIKKELQPGEVYLQSLPFSRLADRIFAASRFQRRDEQKGVAGIGGGLLGGILGGDKNF